MSQIHLSQTISKHLSDEELFRRGHRSKLLALSAAAYFLVRALAHAFDIFADPGYGASLLCDPAPLSNAIKLAAIAVPLGLSVTLLARGIRPDAGLFAAAIGLLAVRHVGGPTGEVYLLAPTSGTLVRLAVESALLLGLLALTAVVAGRFGATAADDDSAADNVHVDAAEPGARWLATLVHAAVMAVAMFVICRSDDRWQVAAATAIGGAAGAIAAVRVAPGVPAWHVWIAPLLLAIAAYLLAAIVRPGDLVIGDPNGLIGPLLRGLPLDYASTGVAGSLYGFWVGRSMLPESQRSAAPRAEPQRVGADEQATPDAAAAQI